MDGIETMSQIRKLSSHYRAGGPGKIIVLTANAIAGVRDELIAKGFDEYLSKPIKTQLLERILEQFIPSADAPEAPKKSLPEGTLLKLENLLPQINIATGLKYCSGDLELYLDILQILYDSAPEQLSDLQRVLTAKDYPNYILQTHSLKSQLLNIGYSLLADEARALEIAGKEGRYDFIKEHHDAFVDSYHHLLKQLETVFATLQSQ